MRLHRRLGVFISAFAAVMIGGAALAAVVVSAPAAPAPADNPAVGSILDEHGDALRVRHIEPIVDVAPDWEFTAHQRVGMVDEDPAKNGYWGTSKPGAVVMVESRFGKGRTETNREGHWELVVEFTGMPCNEWFAVVASSGDHAKTFRMKRVCEPDWRFTAHQLHEIVEGDPATNGYWGTSKPGAIVTVESRFGAARTETNREGHWKVEVEFTGLPCNEPVKVVASSGDHRKAFEMKRVCRVEVDFTAFQKYGECGEEIPYDVFYGEGSPGATVKVSSAHGSGSTKIDAEGHWELRVEFPDAPAGEEFKVSVDSSDGGHAGFTFVNVGGAHV
ncbi:MAG: hypothetical protein R3246_10815 [Acidimicrobiia bacterium]|nr:hypothetical protein [Acidimicrobiia bacterium]